MNNNFKINELIFENVEEEFNFFPNEFNNFNIDDKKYFSFHNESTSDYSNINNELIIVTPIIFKKLSIL